MQTGAVKTGAVNSKWIEYTRSTRLDAAFWTRVTAALEQRGINPEDDKAVRGLIEELEEAEVREALEAEHGQVWNTSQMSADFSVQGFQAPYVVVRRKSDEQLGSLQFTHMPRFYFNFVAN